MCIYTSLIYVLMYAEATVPDHNIDYILDQVHWRHLYILCYDIHMTLYISNYVEQIQKLQAFVEVRRKIQNIDGVFSLHRQKIQILLFRRYPMSCHRSIGLGKLAFFMSTETLMFAHLFSKCSHLETKQDIEFKPTPTNSKNKH